MLGWPHIIGQNIIEVGDEKVALLRELRCIEKHTEIRQRIKHSLRTQLTGNNVIMLLVHQVINPSMRPEYS